MNKEIALERVAFVKARAFEDSRVQEVLSKVEDYINKQETFSHQHIIEFIEEQRSSKLGGIYIYIDKGLDALKNELKSEYKKSNSLKNK